MNKTLLVMAAGMASRYGGGKQVEGFGPNGEMLMEYSIRDAKKAGFDKVVFVISSSMTDDFPELIEARINGIELDYAVQSFDSLPEKFKVPAGRVKPYGTVHAVLSAKDKIKTPFAVLNADDFYGEQAFHDMADLLDKIDCSKAAMVAYPLGKTLSMSGNVTRGICSVDESEQLVSICETYNISRDSDGVIKSYDNSDEGEQLSECAAASMNFWGFTPDFFDKCEKAFSVFLETLAEDELSKEFPLPIMIDKFIGNGELKVIVKITDSEWMGVTYREDRKIVTERLAELYK